MRNSPRILTESKGNSTTQKSNNKTHRQLFTIFQSCALYRFSEHAEEAFLAAVPKEVSAKKEKIPFDKKKKSPSNKESAKLDDSTSSIDLECFDGMNLYD